VRERRGWRISNTYLCLKPEKKKGEGGQGSMCKAASMRSDEREEERKRGREEGRKRGPRWFYLNTAIVGKGLGDTQFTISHDLRIISDNFLRRGDPWRQTVL
jgi:hypothetical protein